MRATIYHMDQEFDIDLFKPIDISNTLRGDDKNPVAWYLDHPRIEPVRSGDFIGSVKSGASTNFNNIYFNPHSHSTHTESVGHITREIYSINNCLKTYFFVAKVISILPEARGIDRIITMAQLEERLGRNECEALVIRTLPNSIAKRSQKYSHTNWPYLEEEAARYIRECGVKHLLVDLPSVDKEKDEGKLLAHKAFWNFPKEVRINATITELIYVPEKVKDGRFLLNLVPASFENDAAPSKPVLYKIENE